MSQWVHAKSKVMEHVDRNLMQKAFERMQVSVNRNVHHIRNTWGSSDVDMCLYDTKEKRDLSVGLNFKDDAMEVVGDFYGSRWRNSEQFCDEFSQAYQRYNIEDVAMANGYMLEEEKQTEDGHIEMYLCNNSF